MKPLLLRLPLTIAVLLSLTGCYPSGGDSSGGSIADVTGTPQNSIYATAKLGDLAGADVDIYEIESDGSTTLVYEETTSSGDTLAEIGLFDSHADALDDNTFYLYKISGGEDWDADDDGNIDASSTTNSGVIRSIAKGSDIKVAADDFVVSYASELLYEKVVSTLRYSFDESTFQDTLDEKSNAILSTDVNGDSTIDAKDFLTYNPITDSSKLTDYYQSVLQDILDAIHNGQTPSLSVSALIGSYDTDKNAKDIALSSNKTTAFIADESGGLVIVDITDDSNMTLLGTYDTTGSTYKVVLSSDDTRAYLADAYGDGLVIIDISDTTNPTLVTTHPTNLYYCEDIMLSDDEDTVYAIDSSNHLVVLDISDENNVTQIGQLSFSGFPHKVTRSSNPDIIYVLGSVGMSIVDVSEPNSPSEIASIDLDTQVSSVVFSNNETIAYVTQGSSGMSILDIENPSSPKVLGTFSTNKSYQEIALSSDNTLAYIAAADDGLIVLDISDRTNPTQVARYLTGDEVLDLVLSDDESTAYLAVNVLGLQAVDLKALGNDDTLINSVEINGNATKLILSADGSTAYVVAGNGGVYIYDVSDDANITELGNYDTKYAYNIALSSDETRLYVADEDGLYVLDVSDPSAPSLYGSYTGTRTYGVTLSSDESIAYLAEKNSVTIVDINSSANPTYVGAYATSSDTYEIVLSSDESTAFVAAAGDGLLVLDVSTPSAPSLMSSLATDYWTYGVTLTADETTAYTSDGDKVRVVNVSNTSTVSQTSAFYTDDGIYDEMIFARLSEDESKLYVANDMYGLMVLNVSDSSAITQTALYPTNDIVNGFDLSSDETKAYVADGDSFNIYDLSLYQ